MAEFSLPAPPSAWGDGCRPTGLIDAECRPIFYKRACGFGAQDTYVVFAGDGPVDD